MGLFDKLKSALNEIAQEPTSKLPAKGKTRANVKKQKSNGQKSGDTLASKSKVKKSKTPTKPKLDLNNPKDLATSKGQPWVTVLGIEIDKDNPGAGAFELDWNDIFVARLIKAGYQGKTDQDIVDNWFQDVCRNVVLETYQQEMADPSNRPSNRKDLGNGRVEIS